MLRRLVIAVAVAALGAVLLAPSAHAAFGIEKFEALTCKTDESSAGVGDWTANGNPCRASDALTRFYTQAAGHPNFGITAFLMNQKETAPPNLPDGFIKEVRTELPEGLGVNPEATPQCTRKKLSEVVSAPPVVTKCDTEMPTAKVGTNYFTTISSGPPAFPVAAGTEFTVPVSVYNLDPEPGEPSSAGFNATGKPTILESDLDPVDQHISFTIHDIESPLIPGKAPVIGSRLVFNGKAGAGYLTMPSNCAGPQVTDLHVISHPYPIPPGPELEDEALSETATGAEGCPSVPFQPTIGASAGVATDSPEAATIDVRLPYVADPSTIANSHLLTAKVVLPQGAGLNPASANGLVACTDAQFAKGTNDPIACPEASKIGTVEVATQALPEVLGGSVYVGEPKSSDPASGEEFRMFLHVDSPKFGVNVRLIGNVSADPQTGQLTAVVGQNPQAPFESFKVKIAGGPKGALTTPGTCGPHATNSQMTPWSGTADVTPSASFTLTSYPGGGACPQTLADRPFAPADSAKSDNAKAGAFSPFQFKVARPDGEQELKAINVTLPKGLTGKLAGIPYCSESSIAAAAGVSGKAEQASPSCPSDSQIGTATTAAGSGSGPIKIGGKAYLAGPYKGAPLSMVVITPAVAGPYDLGTVVVRVALNVNPETAQVNAVSDSIPDVFGGVKLDIRSIDVNVNKNEFMLNPTGCSPGPTSGVLSGGGANPADPSTYSSYSFSSPYAVSDCMALDFKPKLFTRLSGPTKRGKNPQIRAVVEARNGDANIARTALTLPHSLFLDQGHIKTVCTKPQLASQTCPASSVYGNAEAKTPLLSNPLKGSVYLVPSGGDLPNLVADLRGQVNIQLRGVISSKRGGLKTVFNSVPDVPVKKFVLNMKGGKKSLITNSANLCAEPQKAVLNIKAQNGKQVKNNKYRLNISGCQKKK